MEKQLVVVTGGARGIGRAIVERLAEDGFKVLFIDRDVDGSTATERELKSQNLDVTAEILDLTDYDLLLKTIDRYPVPFALINNAGIFKRKDMFETTAEDFRLAYEVNLVVSFVLVRHLAKRMKPGSRIINIASGGYLGGTQILDYATSKGAVVTFTRSLAMEFARIPIMVNAVAPGPTETSMTANYTLEQKAAMMANLPMGRMAKPRDIANAVSFFADQRTDYITGQIVLVDGGRFLGVPML